MLGRPAPSPGSVATPGHRLTLEWQPMALDQTPPVLDPTSLARERLQRVRDRTQALVRT